MLVLDASALAGWLMSDETNVDLAALSESQSVFVAPSLLWAEIRNILVVAERRGPIDRETVDLAIAAIDDLGIKLDSSSSSHAVMSISRRHGLTVYDALYLDFALSSGAALATCD